MKPSKDLDEQLQEQLVNQGEASSMRYIGEDYTRIITIREDRLLSIISTHAKQRVAEVLDGLEATKRTADLCTDDTYVVKQKFIEAERNKLKERDDE